MAENEYEREVEDSGALQMLQTAEVNQQIATAKRYPRDVKAFMHQCLALATLTEETAQECMYALPRKRRNESGVLEDVTIEGPSARLAEIVASSWGNCQAGARVVDEGARFITAQGVFWDLERNWRVVYEVRRRIVDRYNKRYNDDMISQTANAACSIALRNAVFKGVPKAIWASVYERARETAVGTQETLSNRRARAFAVLQKMGATEAAVLAKLGRAGVESVTLDDLAVLNGIRNAIKEGEITVEAAFSLEPEKPKAEAKKAGLNDKLKAKAQAAQPTNEQPEENDGASDSGAEAPSDVAEPDPAVEAEAAADEDPATVGSADDESLGSEAETVHEESRVRDDELLGAPEEGPLETDQLLELIRTAPEVAALDYAKGLIPRGDDPGRHKELRAAARARSRELANG